MFPHSFALLVFGYALALLGAPVLLLVTKAAGGNSLGFPFRLLLWVIAGVAIAIARLAMEHGDMALGLWGVTRRTLMGAGTATVTILAAAPILHYIQKRAAGQTISQSDRFREIIALSIPYRIFIVATAAFTEELLYRGYAIGVGEHILGSQKAAVALSLIVFVGAHIRWGLGHLVAVLWAALVLTALFVVTHDLMACIAAHAALDLIGIVIAPWAMAARSRADGAVRRA